MREVREITERCRECGQATAVLLDETYVADDGTDARAIWAEKIPHNRSDCAQMVALTREQWPVLF